MFPFPPSLRARLAPCLILAAGSLLVQGAFAGNPDLERANARQAELHAEGIHRHSRAVTVGLPAGYISTTVAAPVGIASGDVFADPNDPDVFYVVVTETFSFFRDQALYRMELTGSGAGLSASFSRVAAGTTNLLGDLGDGQDRLDNLFGAPSPAMRPDGAFFVVDNDFGTTSGLAGVIGETILRLTDLDSDGDYSDIVGSTREVAEYTAPLTVSPFGFTGQNAAFDGTGALYTITADSAALGGSEILRIADGATTQTVFVDGLDYGAGLDIDPATGRVWFGDLSYNGSFTTNTSVLLQAIDGNADGDASDPGETAILATGFDGINDIAWDGGDFLYLSTNTAFGFVPKRFQVLRYSLSGGTVEPFADFPEQFFQFVKGVSFDSGSASFAPFSGPGGRRLIVIDSENGINVIEPDAPSAVRDWVGFETR